MIDRRDKPPIAFLSGKRLAVVQAVKRAVDGQVLTSELQRLGQIEGIRSVLLSRNDEIDVLDYGAVAKGSNTSSVSNALGVTVRRRICDICAQASKSGSAARLLFLLVRALEPCVCLELGTSLGISACYQAMALDLNGKGRFFTVEGDPSLTLIARQLLAEFPLQNVEVICGRFQDVLPTIDSRAKIVDYVFMDGHHDGPATLEYFQMLSTTVAKDSVVVVDDIQWSPGMASAWDKIRHMTNVSLSVDLGSMGVVVLGNHGSRVEFDFKDFLEW
jgi:predicted O-methyltransferase YrrM